MHCETNRAILHHQNAGKKNRDRHRDEKAAPNESHGSQLPFLTAERAPALISMTPSIYWNGSPADRNLPRALTLAEQERQAVSRKQCRSEDDSPTSSPATVGALPVPLQMRSPVRQEQISLRIRPRPPCWHVPHWPTPTARNESRPVPTSVHRPPLSAESG